MSCTLDSDSDGYPDEALDSPSCEENPAIPYCNTVSTRHLLNLSAIHWQTMSTVYVYHLHNMCVGCVSRGHQSRAGSNGMPSSGLTPDRYNIVLCNTVCIIHSTS